jgi:hypothetical protein
MARQSKRIAEDRICSQSFLESKPTEAMQSGNGLR